MRIHGSGWRSFAVTAAVLLIGSRQVAHADPTLDWSRTVDQQSATTETGTCIAVTSAGDAVSGGALGGRFAVVKQAEASGNTLWAALLPASESGAFNIAHAVGVGAGGDVFAAGASKNGGTGADFTVVRLAKADGSVKWTRAIDGSSASGDGALALALDPQDNVFAAGYLDTAGTGHDLAAVRLDGATGQVVWQKTISGIAGASGDDSAQAVAIDGDGNVIIAGYLSKAPGKADFAVVKLSGQSGDQIWLKRFSTSGHGLAFALAVPADGNPIAAGVLDDRFTVLKLKGSSGSQLWKYQHSVVSGSPPSMATNVVVTASGIVAGGIDGFTGMGRALVVKLNAANGSAQWERPIGSKSPHFFSAKAQVMSSGEVLAVGAAANGSEVVRLAADGNPIWTFELAQPIAGPGATALRGNAVYLTGSAAGSGNTSDLWTMKLSLIAQCKVGTKIRIECASCKCGKFEHCVNGHCAHDPPAQPGGVMHKAK